MTSEQMNTMSPGMQHLYKTFFAGAKLKADKIVTPEGDIFYAIYRCTIERCGASVSRTSELVSFLHENDCPDRKVLKFLLFRE